MDTKNQIIQVSVSTLKYTNIIDIQGDEISFEHLVKSIEINGVKDAILIDWEDNIVHGNRRVLACEDLLIETIPAIRLKKDITPIEIEKLKIDFFLTSRNLSHLDIIQIYFHQQSIFDNADESYTEYMGNLLACTQRSIQAKVKAGKTHSTLPIELKQIVQSLDSTKKIPFKTFKLMSELEKIHLDNFIKEVLEVENLEHNNLSSITDEYQKKFNTKKRTKKIDEDAKNSKEKVNETISELKSSNDFNFQSDTEIIISTKKVFQYEIKKYFNQEINSNEEKDIKEIQSKLHLDFTEEIELISSFLLLEVAA